MTSDTLAMSVRPLESRAYSRKGMCAIFQNKGRKRTKKGKIFENLGKNVLSLKLF